MDIIYYCENNRSFMGSWQNYHVVDELSHYDINIHFISPSNYTSLDEANEQIILEIERIHPTLFMTVYNEEMLYINTLLLVKSKGVPSLLICHDNLLIPFQHKRICKYFDLVWLTSIENSDYFTKWGANIIFMPYAANPFFFKYTPCVIDKSVAFVGNPYGSRTKDLNDIIRTGVATKLYYNDQNIEQQGNVTIETYSVETIINYLLFPIGRKVMFARILKMLKPQESLLISQPNVSKGLPLEFEEMCRVYSNSALVYSSTVARSTGLLKKPVPVINLRSFEIPMCGGIQICRYNQELAGYFEEDKEILFYRSYDELFDKCNYYTSDKSAADLAKMKEAARLHAEGEHTWITRFGKIFQELGLKNDKDARHCYSNL